jgi:hypothetical protein
VQVVPIVDPDTGVSGFERRVVSTPARDEADHALGLTLRQPIFDGLASWEQIAAAGAGESGPPSCSSTRAGSRSSSR